MPHHPAFTRLSPDPRLHSVIDSYWIIRYRISPAGVLPMLPMGYPFLEFNLGDNWVVRHQAGEATRVRHLLMGLTSTPLYFENTGSVHSVLVRLQPWGLASLFREAHHLNDCFEAGLVLERSYLDPLLTALAAAHSEREYKELLDNFFRLHLHRTPAVADRRVALAMKMVLQKKGCLPIPALEKEVFLSQRRLEQLFKDQVGMSPKTYADIARFQSVLTLETDPSTSLTHLALDAGYYDQSHFIRQFKKFSGRPPSAILRQTDHEDTKISNLYNFAQGLPATFAF